MSSVLDLIRLIVSSQLFATQLPFVVQYSL
jgi:hypothetical protein